jgi:putative membrane protein
MEVFMKKRNLLIPLYGVFMGISDSIPGVSGATIALILGIYENFISAWSFVFSNLLNFKTLTKSREFRFLILLYIGVFLGMFSTLGFIDFLINNYQTSVFSFFSGLIIGSIFFLGSDILKNPDFKNTQKSKYLSFFISAAIGFLVAFYISGAKFLVEQHGFLIIFSSGFLAISAMIVPGISGAYVLLLLNQYSYIVKAVNDFNFSVLITFVLGIVLGLASISRLLKWVLDKFYLATMFFLMGLMVGGLRAPISKIDNFVSFLIFALIGAIVIIIIERFGRINR